MKDWLNIRNALGVFFLYLFWTVLRSSGHVVAVIIGMTSLILAAVCFSRTLGEFVSRPFTRFIDAVYFGRDDRDPPPLNLKLAAACRGERRWDDALAECERQLEYHPRSAELWQEMIRTAQEAGDLEQARDYLRRAGRKVKGEAGQQLQREFSCL